MQNPCLQILLGLFLTSGGILSGSPSRPKVPDLTEGGKRDAKHDWNLGPTGARGWIWGWNLETTDSRQILVTAVAPGSPAEPVLQEGDVILGVGGEHFSSDARKAFGAAITAAETVDQGGKLSILRWRQGKTESAIMTLDVLGSYHDRSPWNCGKSAKIIDAGCAHIANNLKEGIDGKINVLALLASGNDDYLPIVRDYARRIGPTDLRLDISPASGMASWHWGYTNLLLTEYFLATRDREVLPAIREYTVRLAQGQSGVGTWGHTMAWPEWNDGKMHGRLGGYGALNQAGLVCHLSLVLGSKCGVDDPVVKKAIERGNTFFGFYIGKGSIPYGDHPPNAGVHDDNGKNSIAALLFDLQGHDAGVRFFSRMTVASYGERERGHTGNYFSYLWGGIGAMRAGSDAVASYLKEQRWFFDLNRAHDGSFPYQGGAGSSGAEHKYSKWDSTGAFLLSYLLPQGRLHLTGRGVKTKNALRGSELEETLSAGRGFTSWDLGLRPYRSLSTEQLMQALENWSPAVRQRAAKILAEQDDLPMEALIDRLDAVEIEARHGACQAFIALGEQGGAAVDELRELLWSDDLWLRVQAAQALTSVGAPVVEVVPDFLKLIEEQDQADPGEMIQRYLAFCLFSKGGGLGNEGLLARSVEGADQSDLRLAVERLLQNPDARARGVVGSLYRQLSFEEVKPLLPAVHRAIVEPAPSGVMFLDGIRLRGLELLASHRIEEGMSLCLDSMDLDRWGKRHRVMRCLQILRTYGGAAKPLVPRLQEVEARLRQHREVTMLEPHIKEIGDLIKYIEGAPVGEALRSLRDK
ncbi:MAG: acetylesterase [Verrucomicrobiaceae bacterium]|nr:acetylesterase [Verrucomicrobiaceae bacterium]